MLATVQKPAYIDRTTLGNQTYYYQVKAQNSAGAGKASSVLKLKPLKGKPISTPAERLTDRAVVAVNLAGDKGGEIVVSASDQEGRSYTKGVYLSWRKFADDPPDTSYTVYRNDVVCVENLSETNWLDINGSPGDIYRVRGTSDVKLGLTVRETPVWGKGYLELQLFQPAAQRLPDGKVVIFKPNDMSVGDLDGDGQLELIVKWDAGGKDNAHAGFTGTTILDGYDIDFGTGQTRLLWRIDLGVNIRSGAHYTQFQVWDYDGDGKAEIALKTADGTTAYTSTDGTDTGLVETGHVGAVSARFLPVDRISPAHDYRNQAGFILGGPEYFTVFRGNDASILGTTRYVPTRGDVSVWGDTAGNRVDRFLAATAYLDGKAPCIVMGRGYYKRTALTAYYLADTDGDGLGDSIRIKWTFDTQNAGKKHEGQGNHNLSIADVDGDGKDEVIYGSIAFDDDGRVLYNNRLGHGDALHVGNFIHGRKGLEVMSVKENEEARYHVLLSDARTGAPLMGYRIGVDAGRGAAADIDPTSPGAEFWSTADDAYDGSLGPPSEASRAGAVYATTSTLKQLIRLADQNPPANGLMYWDGDLLREIQDHVFDKGINAPLSTTIHKWDYEKGESNLLFSSSEVLTSNGTKGNPGLTGDLLGDWREEMVLRVADDDSKIRIYTTTISTDYVLPCLLEDRQYREGLAWQNTAYNQPPHTSFSISEGLITARVSVHQSSNQTVKLFFTKASDGRLGHQVEGYQIWRWEADSRQKEVIATLALDQIKSCDEGYLFEDKGIQMGKTYFYAVSALVNQRASFRSRSVSITTQLPK